MGEMRKDLKYLDFEEASENIKESDGQPSGSIPLYKGPNDTNHEVIAHIIST